MSRPNPALGGMVMALPCEGGTQHSAPRRAGTAPSVPCCPILQDGRGQGKEEADTLGGDKGSGRHLPWLYPHLLCDPGQSTALPEFCLFFLENRLGLPAGLCED